MRPGRPGRQGPGRDEQGSASTASVGIVGLLVFVTVTLTVVGGAVVAHRGAQSAADLAALAGAGARQRGEDGCAVAASYAARNGSRLVACRAVDTALVVEVEQPAIRRAGGIWEIRARAHAGPAASEEATGP